MTTPETLVIPARWRMASLGEVADVVGGGTPVASDPANFSSDRGHPWLTPADLTHHQGKYISHGRRFLTDQGLNSSGARYVPRGSVLFSSRAPIGYVAIAENDLTTNQGFRTLVPSNQVTSDYLYYTLKALRPIAEQSASGTTFAEISGTKVAQLPIALPPIEEQQSLTRWLDRVTAIADQAVAELATVESTLERAKDAFIEAAISAALNLGETQEATNSPESVERDYAPAPDSELPPIQVPFYKMADLALATRYGISRKAERSAFNDSIPMLRMGNIRDGQLDLSDLQYIADDEQAARFLLEDGDFLFNRTNSPTLVGKSAVFRGDQRMTFASYIIRVRIDNRFAYPEYIALWVNSRWGRNWAQTVKADGISQSNINSKKLLQMPVPLPALAVQRATVEAVTKVRARVTDIVKQLHSTGDGVERSAEEALNSAVMTPALWTEAHLSVGGFRSIDQEVPAVPIPEVPVAISSRSKSDEADLVRLVRAAGGRCTPTQLWQSSAYADNIDSFYCELRNYVDSGRLIEVTSASEEREIEVAP